MAGVPITVNSVPKTLDALEARIRQVALGPWWVANSGELSGVAGDPDTALVQVSLIKYTSADAAAIEAHFGSDVRVLAGDHPLPSLDSSSSDTYPWTAGDDIHDSSGVCTSGFSFASITNDYVSLAGHCTSLTPEYNGPATDTWYASPPGQSANPISTTVVDRTFWDGVDNLDYEMLPGLSSAYVWNGGARLLATSVAQADAIGGQICFDGETYGMQCGVSIVGAPTCQIFAEGGYAVSECGIIQTSRSIPYVAAGDSGGPVLTSLANAQAEPRGTIIGGSGTTGFYLPTRSIEKQTALQAIVPISQDGLASLCLDDTPSSGGVGNSVIINTCSQSNYGSQTFVWGPKDETIHSQNLCLDVYGGGGQNTPVDLYTCNHTGSQQWIWINYPGQLFPHVSLENPQSGLCLDDPTQSQTPGTHLWIHTCNSTVAQLWNVPDQPWNP
jgi:hypothetical protein